MARRNQPRAGPVTLKGLDYSRLVEDYEGANEESVKRTRLSIFLCGKKLPAGNPRDIRKFINRKLESDFEDSCTIYMGEHKKLIRAYKSATSGASNYAEHEFHLAVRNDIDLVIIFPSSPGSFAELGMFCLSKEISAKMFVFISPQHRGRDSYVMGGPVKAAKKRNAKLIFVDYKQLNQVWKHVRQLVVTAKTNKRLNLATHDSNTK